MKQMAEYTVNGIGGNGNSGPELGHGQFTGHVASDGASKFTPKKATLNIDMDKVAAMKAEHEAALKQLENGKSYWTTS